MSTAKRVSLAVVVASLLGSVTASAKWSTEDRIRYDAPTLDGGAGLFRTWSATAGKPWDIRVGIHAEYFTHKEFIVANPNNCGDACPNERNSRFQGAVTVGFTPWKYLEIFGALFSISNINERNHLAPTQEPAVQMALGDWLLGVKGFYPVIPALSLGATFGVKFLNSYGNITPDAAATNVFFAAALSFDVRKLAPKVPLRAHLNLGWIYDASHKVLGKNPGDYTPGESDDSEKHHAFLVQQFALGLNHSRLRWSLGVEAPLPYWGGLLNPIAELQMDVATGSPDPRIQAWQEFTDTSRNYNVTGRLSTRAVLGVRFRPVAGLVLDAGVDIALTHQGFAVGPPLAPWNFFFHAAYAFGWDVKTKTVVKTEVKEVVKLIGEKPNDGRVAGLVKDAKTGVPIAQAILSFPGQALTDLATAEDGRYTSYRLKAGTVKLEVRHPRYKPWEGSAEIQVDKTTTLDVVLEAKAPEVGTVSGTVKDANGKPLGGTIEVEGADKQSATAGVDGTYAMTLKPGAYRVKASAPGHFSRFNAFVVEAGAKLTMDFQLNPRPAKAVVVITKQKLRIGKTIHFAYNKTEVRPDSLQILDEVAEVLHNHPEIQLIRVEGHTDRRGGFARNLKLSQGRAEAVRDYLITQGIDPTRLEAMGYGSRKPLVPELTPRHRAINRRVEFRILRRGPG